MLSLDELMNIPISVASKTELTIRESPAILSVITGDEMRALGVREMIDVLNLIPGFGVGMDVQSVFGMGIRGNWAHEGKILVLLDGIEFNEILYSTVALGQHFDIAQVERMEVIRGPGSSIYGGYAELGVINIITKDASQKGMNVVTQYGWLNDTFARRNVSIALGDQADGVDYSINAFIGQGTRSNQDYVDTYGTVTNLREISSINPAMINAGLKVSNLGFRLIWDNYNFETADQYEDVLPDPLDKIRFQTFFWKS